MTKQKISFFILIIICISFSSCDGMATLFHGEKPGVTFTVTFNANGAMGSPPSAQSVKEGEIIRLPDNSGMTSAGNVFVGWNESQSGTGVTYSVGASITVISDMVFYAQWLDASTPKYTVTFNENGATGGTVPAPQTVYSGISITIPEQGTLVHSEKTFGGWNTQANGGGTNYEAGAFYAVTGNVTLYARWKSDVQYTVTYHANGASGAAPSAQSVDPGTEITLPGAGTMTNTGKTFDGWNTQANGGGTSYAEGAAYTVNANASFYALWLSAPIEPPGATLAAQLAWVATQAPDGAIYDIVVNSDTYLSPTIISTMGRNVTINIYSDSSEDIKTLYLDSAGHIFTISNNIILKLKNVKLVGRLLNTTGLIQVSRGGTLIIESGTLITQNTNNTGPSTDSNIPDGGGIWVNAGTLIMNGGTITGNASRDGGGVNLTNSGSFTMNGGTISNNICLFQGAGVAVYGSIFTIHGGVISGNKQIEGGTGDWIFGGGGVFIGNNGTVTGTFTKTSASGSSTSGVIYGAIGPSDLVNTVTNRKHNGGDAVLAWNIKKHRDSTLGEYDEISSTNLNHNWD